MNVAKKINVDRAYETPIRLISLSLNGYLTSPRLLEMGIYSCNSCGSHGSVDENKCRTCGEDKFVVVDTTEKTCNGVYIPESRVPEQPNGL